MEEIIRQKHGRGTAPSARGLQWRRMSHVEHKATAPQSVRCYVISISDTRTDETDTAGRAIAELLGGAGHQVVGRTIVKDDPVFVRGAIERRLANSTVATHSTT